MTTRLGSRQLIRETIPVAVILVFWNIWSVFLSEMIATGVRYAGIVMALLYVIVRGIQLAGTDDFTAHPDDLAGLLRENGRVALIASVWFLAAILVSTALILVTSALPLGAAYSSAVDSLSRILLDVLETLEFAFTGTGVATVVMYAIAVGLPRCRGHPAEIGNRRGADVRADD